VQSRVSKIKIHSNQNICSDNDLFLIVSWYQPNEFISWNSLWQVLCNGHYVQVKGSKVKFKIHRNWRVGHQQCSVRQSFLLFLYRNCRALSVRLFGNPSFTQPSKEQQKARKCRESELAPYHVKLADHQFWDQRSRGVEMLMGPS